MASFSENAKGCLGILFIICLIYSIGRLFGCGGPDVKIDGNMATINFEPSAGHTNISAMKELGTHVYWTFKKNPALKKIICNINSKCVDEYSNNLEQISSITIEEGDLKNLEILKYAEPETFASSDMWQLTARSQWRPCGNSAME
jgi:hypothetical protein